MKDMVTTETVSTGTAVRDTDLQRRVLNFLHGRNVPGTDHLEVEAVAGAVVVRGRLPSAQARRLCLDCCRRVAGVMQLVDDLEVASS